MILVHEIKPMLTVRIPLITVSPASPFGIVSERNNCLNAAGFGVSHAHVPHVSWKVYVLKCWNCLTLGCSIQPVCTDLARATHANCQPRIAGWFISQHLFLSTLQGWHVWLFNTSKHRLYTKHVAHVHAWLPPHREAFKRLFLFETIPKGLVGPTVKCHDCRGLYIRVNYNDLTATSLEIIGSKGNHPQMALIQVEWNIIFYPDICTPFLGLATRLRFLDSHDGFGPDLRQRWNWPHRCFPKGKWHGMGPKKFDRFLLIHNYNAGPPR